MPDIRPTEAQCQATIVDAAIRLGWRVHAERPAQKQSGKWATSIQGHKGWVDLVLVRGSEALFVELKRKPNKVEPEQTAWHVALVVAGLNVLVVFVPEEQDDLIARLARPPRKDYLR